MAIKKVDYLEDVPKRDRLAMLTKLAKKGQAAEPLLYYVVRVCDVHRHYEMAWAIYEVFFRRAQALQLNLSSGTAQAVSRKMYLWRNEHVFRTMGSPNKKNRDLNDEEFYDFKVDFWNVLWLDVLAGGFLQGFKSLYGDPMDPSRITGGSQSTDEFQRAIKRLYDVGLIFE